ncbi:glycosyl transferase family 1 [Novosphingobium sp. PhB165]|uniref:glycosyltransferase family 4 protein n=1 Tax=Novosphingobium sp. PhB165 TaxID=2485105 RepID=UPI00104A58B3|nr:glycosyltransferase family 4 protein [Novosphingobium sp. PhB165]TCM20527.1 glycosyl transferase family 1 [Novosphingobium sp. PhB165]
MPARRVIFPFTNAQIGGSHVSSFTLGACLQSEYGVEVVVAAPRGSLIEQVARERDFTVWPLPEAPAFRHGLVAEARLLPGHLRLLAEQPPGTVVHNNDLSALQSWGPAARLRGLPVVYHNRAFNRTALPNVMVMSLAHRIVCISEAVEQRLPPRLARRSVRIDNPFELETGQDRAALRRAFEARHPKAAGGGPLIGFIGNFAHRKRPRFFLDMAKVVLELRPDATFVVFGREVDDTQEALERHAAELGIAARVIFAGFRMPVEENILVLDLLAITAIEEPLGRTPLEALMLGVPYVATDDAGLGETGRRFGGGLLVPREAGPEVFAQAVLQGLSAPDSGQWDEARRQARDALSARHHTQRMLALYDELTA